MTSMSEDDPVDLPPMTVQVRHRQTGGSITDLVLVSMGLVPFVQAVAAAFGTRFAQGIDAGTRRAVRRLLHRAHQPPDGQRRADRVQVSVSLTDDNTGARVLLDDDLPAEAVAALVRIAVSPQTVAGGAVLWHPRGAADGHWYIESEGRLVTMWDHAAHRWQPAGRDTT